jgi:Putative DNA-binding domain
MTIAKLKEQWDECFVNIRDHNEYKVEGHSIDYKSNLNIPQSLDISESNENLVFFSLAIDIISYANSDGALIILGVEEDKLKDTEKFKVCGVNSETSKILENLDCSKLKQLIQKITGYSLAVEKDSKKVLDKVIYALMIPKAEEVLVVQQNYLISNIPVLTKGNVHFRDGDGNEKANDTSSRMNKFIQIKANEKSKDFMKIWSNLLPEMIDINPKEILILNVEEQKVYGFNKTGNRLDSGKIKVEDRSNTFKVILESIQAGEIGKISNDEGKPVYRIVGDYAESGDPISTCSNIVSQQTNYSISANDIKKVLKYLGFVTTESIAITLNSKVSDEITTEGKDYIFPICTNQSKNSYTLRFSSECTNKVIETVKNSELHETIFGKILHLKTKSVLKK